MAVKLFMAENAASGKSWVPKRQEKKFPYQEIHAWLVKKIFWARHQWKILGTETRRP
jgi:hypothetical protein